MVEGLGKVAVESLGYDGELTELCKRFQSRDYGNVNAMLLCLFYKLEILRIVIEELRYGISGAHFCFLPKDVDVAFYVGGFLVFLGVACHSEFKRLSFYLYGRAVPECSFIEAVYLLNEFCGMSRTIAGGAEGVVLARLVATQYQQVVDSEELQVEKHVFEVFAVVSTADNVGNNV